MPGRHTKIAGKGIEEITQSDYRMDAYDNITNYGGGGMQQNGTANGVVNAKNDVIDALLVAKLEGPLDDDGKKVEKPQENQRYWFKATFNRSATLQEIKTLKWSFTVENGQMHPITTNYSTITEGGQTLQVKLPFREIRLFAYFQRPIRQISLELKTADKEVFIIIGTEQDEANAANKLMFPAQAVRTIRMQYKTHEHLKVLMFTDRYTEASIKAVEDAVKLHNSKAVFSRINSTDELLQKFNEGDIQFRKITHIYAYAHGNFENNKSVIQFGYKGVNQARQVFSIDSFNQINKELFLTENQTAFYSYACRTGAGVDSESASDPQKHLSMAQNMATQGKITVHAYMRRSLYADTWGKQRQRDSYASDNDTEDSMWDNFKVDLKDNFTAAPENMTAFTTYREKEVKVDGLIWNPDGAFYGVTAGTWPVRFPATYEVFKP